MPRMRTLALVTSALVLARVAAYAWIAVPFGGLTDAVCQYDCGWYVRLAVEGYQSDSQWDTLGPVPNWAFFPLYPMLIRGAIALTRLPPELAGMLVANLLFIGFVLAGAVYLRRTRPTLDPMLWVLFAVLFPFGFTFSVPYTESLFALLTIGTLLALQRERLLLAAGLTALLCATRPTGVLLIPVILAVCATKLWRERHAPDRLHTLSQVLLPIAVAPLGLSLFMLYQYVVIGDALAFSHVQLLWGREWRGPLYWLTDGITAWDWGNMLHPNGYPSKTYDCAWTLLGLGVAARLAWQRRFAEAWLLAGTIVLPLSTALHSLPRFVATSPFFLFACCSALAPISSLRWRAVLAGGLGLVQGAVVVGWYISSNALY